MIKKADFNSSMLRRGAYDASSRELLVQFCSDAKGVGGDVYRYDNVPMHVWTGLLTAPSHGRFFLAEVKDKFTFQRGSVADLEEMIERSKSSVSVQTIDWALFVPVIEFSLA